MDPFSGLVTRFRVDAPSMGERSTALLPASGFGLRLSGLEGVVASILEGGPHLGDRAVEGLLDRMVLPESLHGHAVPMGSWLLLLPATTMTRPDRGSCGSGGGWSEGDRQVMRG